MGPVHAAHPCNTCTRREIRVRRARADTRPFCINHPGRGSLQRWPTPRSLADGRAVNYTSSSFISHSLFLSFSLSFSLCCINIFSQPHTGPLPAAPRLSRSRSTSAVVARYTSSSCAGSVSRTVTSTDVSGVAGVGGRLASLRTIYRGDRRCTVPGMSGPIAALQSPDTS